MIDPFYGSVANFGSNALGSVLSFIGARNANKANIAMNDANNRTNMLINQQQMQNAWKMWKATNAYNNPIQQRARLISAGVNPQSMVDNGQAQLMEFPQSHGAQRPQALQNEFAGFNLGSPGTDIINSELARRELKQRDLDNSIKGIDAYTYVVQRKLDLEQKLANLEHTKEKTQETVANIEKMRQEINHLDKLNVLLLNKAQVDLSNAGKLGQLYDSERALNEEQTNALIQRVLQDWTSVRETVRHNSVMEGFEKLLVNNTLLNDKYNRAHTQADTQSIIQAFNQSKEMFPKLLRDADNRAALADIEKAMGTLNIQQQQFYLQSALLELKWKYECDEGILNKICRNLIGVDLSQLFGVNLGVFAPIASKRAGTPKQTGAMIQQASSSSSSSSSSSRSSRSGGGILDHVPESHHQYYRDSYGWH